MHRPRVLLIAEACNPRWVSVPLVGWSHARALAKVCDVHLVTQIRNRQAILEAGLVEGKDFTAIDSEAITGWAWKLIRLIRGGKGKGWTTGTAISALTYPYFEHLVWQKFARRIWDREFDIVHRLTPLSPTYPSSLAQRCEEAKVPFVLGPLNGGVPWPKQFDGARRAEKEWLSYVRGIHKLQPHTQSTLRSASAIFVASRDTLSQIPKTYRDKCFYIPENAIDPTRFGVRRTRLARIPLSIVFVGRLVPYKGADMLLEAATTLLHDGKLILNIIGDGPEMQRLKEYVVTHDLTGCARLVGWVDHAHVQQWLTNADLFVFPSIREFGGAVALEAMAVGLPPVVIDYAGPAELVTPKTGFLIPMGSRREIVENLRTLLTDLAQRPSQIDGRALAAYERAHRLFSWDAKAQQVLQVYRWLMNPHSPPPKYPIPTPDLTAQVSHGA